MIANSILLLLCFFFTLENVFSLPTKRIVFGQSAVFSGPAKDLGADMQNGLLTAFEEANRKNTIPGYTLALKSYDDGYEPDRAINNTTKLIREDNVFAIIGAVGTPTSKAAQPVAQKYGKMFIGAFTGAAFLRVFNPKIINVRASYDEETEKWVAYAVDKLGLRRVALFYQDDSFGMAGFNGVTAALKKRGLELVGEGTYVRNTKAVKTAALDILESKPQIIFMVGTYAPCALFIKLIKELSQDPHNHSWLKPFEGLFVNISFVGANSLAKELGSQSENVLITTVMPIVSDMSYDIVKDFNKAFEAFSPGKPLTFVSLEGYAVGRFIINVLGQIEGEITPEAFENKIYSQKHFNVGGLTLSFSKENKDNQGLSEKNIFFVSMNPDGKFEYFNEAKRKNVSKKV